MYASVCVLHGSVVCVCVAMGVCATGECGGPRTTFRSWILSSTVGLGSHSDLLGGECLYPQSPLPHSLGMF